MPNLGKNSDKVIKNLVKKRKAFSFLYTRFINSDIIFENNIELFQTSEYLPLIPKQEKMVAFSNDANVLELTAASYNQMVEFLARKSIAKKLKLNFIKTNKRPKFRNIDIVDFYRNKVLRYYNVFIKHMNNRPDIKINNFNDFYAHFTSFIYEAIEASPFTFYSSIYASPTYYSNTGLVIYLKSKNLDDDNQIFKELSIREVNFFIDIAKNFGFEVDKRIPYRMVFNPRRLTKYSNLSNFYEDNFEDYYEIELAFLDSLFEDIYDIYVKSKESNYTPVDLCKDLVPTRRIDVDGQLNLTQADKISFYLECLLVERKVTFLEQKKDILETAIAIAETLDMRASMVYIMGQVNRLANSRVTIVSNARF
jgi:hypothetical protein